MASFISRALLLVAKNSSLAHLIGLAPNIEMDTSSYGFLVAEIFNLKVENRAFGIFSTDHQISLFRRHKSINLPIAGNLTN